MSLLGTVGRGQSGREGGGACCIRKQGCDWPEGGQRGVNEVRELRE